MSKVHRLSGIDRTYKKKKYYRKITSDVEVKLKKFNAYDRIKCIQELSHHNDDSSIDREIKCIDINRGDHAIGKVIKCLISGETVVTFTRGVCRS